MKVHVLVFKHDYIVDSVIGVFSSYSAMLTYLKGRYDFDSPVTEWSDGKGGSFKSKLIDNGIHYYVDYVQYDVIGEHSALTGTISV